MIRLSNVPEVLLWGGKRKEEGKGGREEKRGGERGKRKGKGREGRKGQW